MVGHAMAGKDLQSVSYKYDFSKQEACNLQLEINTKTKDLERRIRSNSPRSTQPTEMWGFNTHCHCAPAM